MSESPLALLKRPADAAARRDLAEVCLVFSASVALCVAVLPVLLRLGLAAIALGFGLGALINRKYRPAAYCFALMLGFGLCWYAGTDLNRLEQNWDGESIVLRMQAQNFGEETPFGEMVEVRVESAGALKGERIELYLEKGTFSGKPGDELEAQVNLYSARDNEQDFYALANGIRLKGYGRQVSVSEEQTPLRLYPVLWANELGRAMEELFPEESAGFLFALTTGNRTRMSLSLRTMLSDTGLSHITAASGLHLNLLFSVLFLLPGGQKRKSLLLIPATVAFAALAGFTPSISRAMVMQVILLLGPVFEREEDELTSLSFALALLLWHNPYSVAGVSLQLSFAAMFGLLVLYPALPKGEGKRSRVLGVLKGTLCANAFTLPLVLWHFGRVSLLTPVSNLLVLWCLPFLLPLAMVCGILGILCLPAAKLLALPVGLATKLLLQLIHALAALPGITRSGAQPTFWAWLMLAYVVVGFILFGQLKGRDMRLALAALMLCLLLSDWAAQPPAGHWRISLLDVGQGQSILMTDGEHTMVVDCGSTGTKSGAVLVSALKEAKVTQVDLLLLTHFDEDHTNGLETLLEAYPVDTAIVPTPTGENETAGEQVCRMLEEGGAKLLPQSGEGEQSMGTMELTYAVIDPETENGGLALQARIGEFSLLITGDLPAEGEAELMQRLDVTDTSVLIAGHHGSRYSTGMELLEAAMPQAVLISAGEGNAYGHPTGETLARIRAVGAQVRRTDCNGTIVIEV